ncbi:hypothetical protein CFAM422_005763 [Trichoderma lentiforme]|uniref:RRM domain-containing protein n=1 Tax=Trichoderma lentiforme TaxID=1567552 RepID=A0A9P5CF28_9HYPO|nr:hypothetical protein CFAM422_005763 [Trichoderma lentiforme]
MAPRDDQFEAQIEPYRRERRLLVARNIYWEATRAEFETTVRTRLTMGDTVSRFFWLPQTDRRFRRNNKRHRGYVFILFNTKQDAQRALRELRPFDFHGRRVMIDFAGREAFVSRSVPAQGAAPAAAAPAAAAPAAAAPAAAARTTPVPSPAPVPTPVSASAAAPSPAATNRNPSDSTEEPRTSWW